MPHPPTGRREPSALFVTTVPITLEAFLVPFAEHFRALGWRIDALANGAAEDAHLDGVFDRRFDVRWSRNPLDPRNLLGSARRVREVVSEGPYDIVHVHTPVAAFVTRFALRSLPAKPRPVVVYTAHGFHFYRGGSRLKNALYRLLERIAAPWTDYLVTINGEDYEAARALGGIDPSRVRLIPGIGVDIRAFAPGVDAATTAAVRAVLDVPSDAFMLTMVAEFAPVKRHGHLLEALALVRDPRVVLVLVGAGPLEATLRSRAAALGVERRVRWAGYRRDVPAVLAASDALVLVSEREGLPRSVLEAMAAGRAVIGTATRGIADAVNGCAGWIVPKHDVRALAAAIETAAADPAETARRGAAARARVEAEYALPRIVEEYEELYREALASRV
jgi:glycosyltransferase involved in cell wall biosynthesis